MSTLVPGEVIMCCFTQQALNHDGAVEHVRRHPKRNDVVRDFCKPVRGIKTGEKPSACFAADMRWLCESIGDLNGECVFSQSASAVFPAQSNCSRRVDAWHIYLLLLVNWPFVALSIATVEFPNGEVHDVPDNIGC
jgi:hypothetical protein